MESEKVKEIKKSLECCSTLNISVCDKKCPYDKYGTKCMTKLAEDSITFINELESEKERLINNNYRLLERNRDLTRACDTCRISLKQFAERLKEKFNDTEYRAMTKRKTISVEELKAQMDWILHEVVIKNIDETLKEFINKGESEK